MYEHELNPNPNLQERGELDLWVAELRGAAQAMNAVADRLTALFHGGSGGNGSHGSDNSKPQTQTESADPNTGSPTGSHPAEPEAAQPTSPGNPAPAAQPGTLTLEEVRAVLAEKSRAGYTAEVRGLLEKHGAAKLSEIDPAQYPTLMAEGSRIGLAVAHHG